VLSEESLVSPSVRRAGCASIDLRTVLGRAAAGDTLGDDGLATLGKAKLALTDAAEESARPLIGQEICPGQRACCRGHLKMPCDAHETSIADTYVVHAGFSLLLLYRPG